MELLALLRMLGGLGVVLGLLAGALWVVRRYDIKLPGRIAGGAGRRLEMVERLPLDARRSIALIRRDGREHLLLIAPEGTVVVESAIIRDEHDTAAAEARLTEASENAARMEAEAAAMRETFASLVDKASGGLSARMRRRREDGFEGDADA